MKNILPLLVLFIIQSSLKANTDCDSILGYFETLTDDGTTYAVYHFDDDETLTIFKYQSKCEVQNTYKFTFFSDTLYLDGVDGRKNTLFVEELTCDRLVFYEVKYGNNKGRVFNYSRVDKHDCSKPSYTSRFNWTKIKGFFLIIWGFILMKVVAWILFFRNIGNWPFVKSTLIKGLGSSILFTIILYFSAYGLYSIDKFISDFQYVNGELNQAFYIRYLPYPYGIALGDGDYSKALDSFRPFCIFYFFIVLTGPLAIWSAWRVYVTDSRSLAFLTGIFNRATLGIGLFAAATLILFNSYFFSEKAIDTFYMSLAYVAYLIFLRKTFWDGIKSTRLLFD